MTMDMQDLKDWFSIAIVDLKQEIIRLSNIVDNQQSTLRTIELTATTRVAEISKDIEAIYEKINEIRKSDTSVHSVDNMSFRTLQDDFELYKGKQETKWTEQTKINERIKMLNGVLWAIFVVVVSILGAFIWAMIVNGGIKGLTESL